MKEMPRIGVEPTHLTALDPKSSVSTNSTTWALEIIYITLFSLTFAISIYDKLYTIKFKNRFWA